MDFLDAASDVALARLKSADGDVSRLDDPFRTVAVIYSAQGVIDNGGLRYFFENDWPGQPPYSAFSEAYRAIGASPEARAIEAGAAMFPFPTPEREETRRRRLLQGSGAERIEALDASFKSDVWARLAEYAQAHKDAFPGTAP